MVVVAPIVQVTLANGEVYHLDGPVAQMIVRLIEPRIRLVIEASDRGEVAMHYIGKSVDVQPAPMFKANSK